MSEYESFVTDRFGQVTEYYVTLIQSKMSDLCAFSKQYTYKIFDFVYGLCYVACTLASQMPRLRLRLEKTKEKKKS